MLVSSEVLLCLRCRAKHDTGLEDEVGVVAILWWVCLLVVGGEEVGLFGEICNCEPPDRLRLLIALEVVGGAVCCLSQ